MGELRGGQVRRHAVLLAKGRYADERSGFEAETGPRSEFLAIAQAANADILSYVSAAAGHGRWFQRAFAARPWYGSALDFALRAGRYESCYVTGEEVGLPVAAALAVRRWRGRLVVAVHNVTPRKVHLFRMIGHRRFAALIVVSERQRRALIEQCGIPAEKVHHAHNWVDDEYFRPDPAVASNVPPVVMACGAENRDYATLVAAAGKVDATFEVFAHGFFGENAGRGKDAVAPNVRQMPRVPFEDLRAAYQKADIVAVPLNDVDYAAGATGIVEAMACGRPIIATRSQGLQDYFAAIDPMGLVTPGDPDVMAAALTAMLALPAEARQTMGKRYRTWIEANCSQEAYAARVAALMGAR